MTATESNVVSEKTADESRTEMEFEEIYHSHAKKILNLAYRMTGREETARDLTQDVFVKVYENIDKFRGDSQVFTWLYRIATNHIINYLKREKRLKWLNLLEKSVEEVVQEDDAEPAIGWQGSAPRPDRQMEKQQREQLLWSAVQSLPIKYRVPLVLHRYEEMSYKEIAEVLQLSMSAVETRIHRGKKELIKRLTPYLDAL